MFHRSRLPSSSKLSACYISFVRALSSFSFAYQRRCTRELHSRECRERRRESGQKSREGRESVESVEAVEVAKL